LSFMRFYELMDGCRRTSRAAFLPRFSGLSDGCSPAFHYVAASCPVFFVFSRLLVR
jgi:hypothetical protein